MKLPEHAKVGVGTGTGGDGDGAGLGVGVEGFIFPLSLSRWLGLAVHVTLRSLHMPPVSVYDAFPSYVHALQLISAEHMSQHAPKSAEFCIVL